MAQRGHRRGGFLGHVQVVRARPRRRAGNGRGRGLTGSMSVEVSEGVSVTRRCPGCGSGRGAARGSKGGFELLSCRACGTLYAAALPASAPSEDYDGYYGEGNLHVPEFIDRRLDEIVAGFEPYRREGRLLDVGCGAGTFLRAAGRAGWTAVGVEVNATAAEHNRAAGFEVFNGE